MNYNNITNVNISCGELAKLFHGFLENCPTDRIINEVKAIDDAKNNSLSFLANNRYYDTAMNSSAGLILVNEIKLGDRPQLIVDNPYSTLADAITLFHPEPNESFSNEAIHSSAIVGNNCQIATNVTIGARSIIGNGSRIHPGVHISDDCIIGNNCELFPGVILYRKTKLGENVIIHSNSVIGADGYSYVLVDNIHKKIPQIGWVEIENDVEIGSCTTVDRGALGPTIIQTGTKIDNQCQIAHNVNIGRHCLVIAQTGISGSTSLGEYVTLAGKVGTVGHIHIGDHSIASGNTMIAKDAPPNSFLSGYLARPHQQWLECQAALNKLPKIIKNLQLHYKKKKTL